jgi:hypothetical protein
LHPIDLTETPDNILVRIRNGFGMPDLNTPQVAIQQAAYLNHPQSLIRALQRSRRYMFHIVEELQKRGMPTELALLPVVKVPLTPWHVPPHAPWGCGSLFPQPAATMIWNKMPSLMSGETLSPLPRPHWII